MARRHLSNPREGEGKGHGRDRRELRALRQRVRDLEAQVACYQQPDNKSFDAELAKLVANTALIEQQAAQMITQRQALARCQGKLSRRILERTAASTDGGPLLRALHKRLVVPLARASSWLGRLLQGAR